MSGGRNHRALGEIQWLSELLRDLPVDVLRHREQRFGFAIRIGHSILERLPVNMHVRKEVEQDSIAIESDVDVHHLF